MAVRYLFLDESGDLVFAPKGTRFFTVTSIAIEACEVGSDLLELRRTLAREEVDLFDQFHATEDAQSVRDRVFEAIGNHRFRLDVTILEKSRTDAHLVIDPDRLYRLAIYSHLRHAIPAVFQPGDDGLVVCAALGTKRQMAAHLHHLRYVVREVTPPDLKVGSALWRAAAEPCLQVADYCCWAIHRKWERNDTRSYDLISDRIESEFLLFGPTEE
ncbi:MAG: DUF3800 domain-containing protein [Thermomicrobiales bacterium]